MATPQSPFSFLDGLFARVAAGPQPPQWLVHEAQQRIVLFLNHVLMQEQVAMDRLVRQKGRIAHVQWRHYALALVITPAGLLNLAPEGAVPDLRLEVTDPSPLSLAQAALRGDKPAIRIEGDVQLAADINWLVDNVRWDVEDDLARVIGDVPAHTAAQMAGRVAQALRQFVGARMARSAGSDAPAAAPSYSAPSYSATSYVAPSHSAPAASTSSPGAASGPVTPVTGSTASPTAPVAPMGTPSPVVPVPAAQSVIEPLPATPPRTAAPFSGDTQTGA